MATRKNKLTSLDEPDDKEFLKHLTKCVSLGMSSASTAAYIGIPYKTFEGRIRARPEFQKAFLAGHRKMSREFAMMCQALAKDGNKTAIRIIEKARGHQRRTIRAIATKESSTITVLEKVRYQVDRLIDSESTLVELETAVNILQKLEEREQINAQLVDIKAKLQLAMERLEETSYNPPADKKTPKKGKEG